MQIRSNLKYKIATAFIFMYFFGVKNIVYSINTLEYKAFFYGEWNKTICFLGVFQLNLK